MEVIQNPKAGKPIGPYNQAIKAGNTLYVSGQICLDGESGKLVNSTIEDETHQVMKNLQLILEAAELDFSHVAKCSIFLKNMDDFQVVNQIYGSYFTQHFPARETVEVSRLPKDVRVEISLIAIAT